MTILLSLLGKKGKLTELLKNLAAVPVEERRQLGEILNNYKNELQEKIQAQKKLIADHAIIIPHPEGDLKA